MRGDKNLQDLLKGLDDIHTKISERGTGLEAALLLASRSSELYAELKVAMDGSAFKVTQIKDVET